MRWAFVPLPPSVFATSNLRPGVFCRLTKETRSPPKCKEHKMNRFTNQDHVLPRPVERLPEFAHARARNTLADKLVAAFGLSNSAAAAIANAVVDPALVRKNIGEVNDPQVEYI